MQKLTILLILLMSTACHQPKEKMNSLYKIQERIISFTNLPYKVVDSMPLHLDVYVAGQRLGAEPWFVLPEKPKPVVIYFHGGGWVEGDRTSRFLNVLPYLEKEWTVVNVDYRLLQQTDLLGCLADCLAAIHWTVKHATDYKIDTQQIYLSGESAGGHLALLAGLMDVPTQKEYLSMAPSYEIQGIINWFGITEMESAIQFWNDKTYTKMILNGWQGSFQNFCRLTSPINYISKDTPPIISIHGDADINVPFEQATKLHQELEKAGIFNHLHRITGKQHGGFTAQERLEAFAVIWDFFLSPSQ